MLFRKLFAGVVMLFLVACSVSSNVGAQVSAQTIPTAESTSISPTSSTPNSTEPEPTGPPTFRPDPTSIETTTTTSVVPTSVVPSSSSTSTTVPPNGPTLAPVCGVPEGQGAGCRLIAYYGNPQSKGLGILGRTDKATMLASLKNRVGEWEKADPATPTKCALELIAIVAQSSPGPSNTYRGRADGSVVRKVLGWAREAGCLLLLDVQVGWSTVQAELPYLEPFLREPDVHLALDPEWDMPPGVKPGSQIGTMDAEEINAAVTVLDRLVTELKLPPKLLVVHRFRDFMVTNPGKIKTPQTIRLVSNMDGFGTPARKLESYKVALRGMPTRLSGFKLFTNPKLDTPMLTPNQVLGGKVQPVPVFINYQ